MLSRRLLLLPLLLVLGAVPARAAGAGLVPGETSGAGPTRPNLLLITLDTTRAMDLGCYGYPLPTSPQLDALAARGVRFAEALTQVPLTGPSHATILTGLYPHEHGGIRNGVPIPEAQRTLAEVMSEAGYRTAAFLSGWTLRSNLSGLNQGFELYDDSMQDRYRVVNTQRFAHQVTPLAIDWLEANAEQPFFLWVHYFDPHTPYNRREHFDELRRAAEGAGLERDERHLEYDSEIRYMDTWVGKLLATLPRLGVEENTLVVVAGDHGEALGEHGYVGHGRRLYEEILQVPFLLSWPGRLPAGRVVEQPVALLDVTPTVLRLLGLPPMIRTSGIDLSPMVTAAGEEPPVVRQIGFETYPGARKKLWSFFSPKLTRIPILVGYREGSLKFLYDTKKRNASVFDLASDPVEMVNLIDRYPGLRTTGERLVQRIEASAAEMTDARMSADDEERLRSLGYNQ